jgi:hypothetical protein
MVAVAELTVRQQWFAHSQLAWNVAGASLAVLIATEAVSAEARETVVVLDALFADFSFRNADAFEARHVAAVFNRAAVLIAAEVIAAGL